MWTDETTVKSHPNNRRLRHWTKEKKGPVQVKMHSGGNSVMFWGSISKHGRGNLVSICGNMNSKEYLTLLKESVVDEFQYAKEQFPGDWHFMQDNAPCHKEKNVMAFLRRSKIPVIDWPPYSPDLNPIENVWSWMKRKLETEFPVCHSAEEIETRFFLIWDQITPQMCAAYCEHYEKRLLAVIEANGGYTKY
jgi:hypothetical protein